MIHIVDKLSEMVCVLNFAYYTKVKVINLYAGYMFRRLYKGGCSYVLGSELIDLEVIYIEAYNAWNNVIAANREIATRYRIL